VVRREVLQGWYSADECLWMVSESSESGVLTSRGGKEVAAVWRGAVWRGVVRCCEICEVCEV
jgi:hypothetical protein